MDQYIGKLLDNRYEILETVGSGGMARVYKARDHRLNRLVAIKILREDLAQDAEFRRRFHDESQAVAMLSHPNIVAIYDVSRSSELEYIVMELIDGITLKQYMQRKGGKLNWREALHFTIQIVKALGHAHSRGIIHRDIKPHNVMVLRDGSVKVADFGIARVSSGGHSTLTQEALGSVHYISPEQARGSHIDARSDLYSAGVVLYEMITGRLPFEGDTPVSVAIQHINSIPLSPRELEPSIPEALEAITMKAMAPDPDNRYLSAGDMLLDLEEFRKNPDMNFEYAPISPEVIPEPEPDDDRTQIIRSASLAYERGREGRHAAGERQETYSRQERRSRVERRERQEDYGDVRSGGRSYDDDRPGGVSVWSIAVIAVAVVAFLALVFYVLQSTVFSGLFTPPETYSVPGLTGKLYEDVLNNTELLGRFTLALGETVADEAEPGTILSQDPAASAQVSGDVTEITVTVSGGQEEIIMPDLTDMEYTQALVKVKGMGLAVEVPTFEYSDKVEINHVISFVPLKENPVPPGTKVQMTVSRGPEIKRFPMPNLEGMIQEEAEKNIDALNLKKGEITQVFSDKAEGVVVYQFPAYGADVEEGDEVTLQVSKGPDPSTQEPGPSEPNNGEEPPGGGTTTPQPAPEGTEYVDISLPESEEPVRLVVMMDGSVIFDQTFDTTMDLVASVPVKGVWGSTKTITYFFNGILEGSVQVEIKPRV